MASDDTVLILRTKGELSKPVEYRVAWAPASVELFYMQDAPGTAKPQLNAGKARRIFKDSILYSNADDALMAADKMVKDLEVEYGITVVNCSDIVFPT